MITPIISSQIRGMPKRNPFLTEQAFLMIFFWTLSVTLSFLSRTYFFLLEARHLSCEYCLVWSRRVIRQYWALNIWQISRLMRLIKSFSS